MLQKAEEIWAKLGYLQCAPQPFQHIGAPAWVSWDRTLLCLLLCLKCITNRQRGCRRFGQGNPFLLKTENFMLKAEIPFFGHSDTVKFGSQPITKARSLVSLPSTHLKDKLLPLWSDTCFPSVAHTLPKACMCLYCTPQSVKLDNKHTNSLHYRHVYTRCNVSQMSPPA